jgi:hypothetical protein
MTNILNSRIYKLVTVNTCNSLNFSLQDVLCLNPNVTLIIVFCVIKCTCKVAVELQKMISY